MRITTKGQVTIPLQIRREFGLKPGTDVEFVTDGRKVVVQPRRKRRDPVEEWLKEATGIARGGATTAKIMNLTRGKD